MSGWRRLCRRSRSCVRCVCGPDSVPPYWPDSLPGPAPGGGRGARPAGDACVAAAGGFGRVAGAVLGAAGGGGGGGRVAVRYVQVRSLQLCDTVNDSHAASESGGGEEPVLGMLTSMDEVRAPWRDELRAEGGTHSVLQVTALRVLHHAMEWLDDAQGLRCGVVVVGLCLVPAHPDDNARLRMRAYDTPVVSSTRAGCSPCWQEVRAQCVLVVIICTLHHRLTPILQWTCPWTRTPGRA